MIPWSTDKHVRSGALIRAHCHPDQQIHRISNWPAKLFALFLDSLIDRQTSRDQELLSELIDSQSIKNVLRSGALIRAHWLPDRPTNTFCDRKLLSELIVTPIDQKLLAIRSSYQSLLTPLIDQKTLLWSGALIRAHCHPDSQIHWISNWPAKLFCTFFRLPDRQINFSRSGALIRAYWLPINQKRLAIRSSYQSSLTPWSTNKHVMIGSSYQSSLSPRSTTWISDWPTNFLQSRALTRAHSVPERKTHVLRSEALIGAHLLPDRSKTSCDQELLSELIDSPDRPKNLLWSGALIRAHCHPDQQIH